jgi:hypothetical protein
MTVLPANLEHTILVDANKRGRRNNSHIVNVWNATWTDAGLGVRKPNTAFASVITPGYIVQVNIGGIVHIYHTDSEREVIHIGVLVPDG